VCNNICECCRIINPKARISFESFGKIHVISRRSTEDVRIRSLCDFCDDRLTGTFLIHMHGKSLTFT